MAKKPCFSINLIHGIIVINPTIAVRKIPKRESFEKGAKLDVLKHSTISKNKDPQMLGIANIKEKLIALFLSIANILDAVIQIPSRLTPGKIEIVWQQPIINALAFDNWCFPGLDFADNLSNRVKAIPKIMQKIPIIFGDSNSFTKSLAKNPKMTTGIVPKKSGQKYVSDNDLFPKMAFRISAISLLK